MASSKRLKTPDAKMPSSPTMCLSESLHLLNEMRKKRDGSADSEQPYNPGSGFRDRADSTNEYGEPFGTGYSDLVQLRDDLLVRITSAVSDRTVTSVRSGENWLKFEFWIAGKASLIFEDCGQIDFEGRWCFVHWHPKGVDKGELVGEGEGIAVTIYCRPSFLEDVLGDQVNELPKPFRELVVTHCPDSMFEILPLTEKMARAVTDMVNAKSIGNLRHIFMYAKTMELFSAAIDILFMRDEESEHSVIKRLNRSEITRLQAVRDHIVNNLANPPKIATLCRRAGMSQQKLQQGFKALFNETISEFCVARRMEKARELLELNDLTVTQVAHAVGYEFANNFSTAYKRYFGILPKTYQMKFSANVNLADKND